MTHNDDIVLLGTAGSEVEAGMWNQVLRSEGIRALVRPGGPGAGAWASAATFEHQVFVRADQLDRARSVLEGALQRQHELPRARRSAPVVNAPRVRRHR